MDRVISEYSWAIERIKNYSVDINIIAEIGSRDGFDAIELSREFNPESTYIFEPDPLLASKINERLDINAGGSFLFDELKSYGDKTLDNSLFKAGFVLKLGKIDNGQPQKSKDGNSVSMMIQQLNLKNQEFDSNISDLENKKNQLEIEKKELEDKFNLLREDYDSLSKKIEEIKNKEKMEERKQIEFSEKIDELNQETDTLLEEIDKWQM